MNKTEIFESYGEFLERVDKKVNGVSREFAEKNSNYKEMNQTNKGCWNCLDCFDCVECNECVKCVKCIKCFDCFDCFRCINCIDIEYLSRRTHNKHRKKGKLSFWVKLCLKILFGLKALAKRGLKLK